jgi:methylmalonyl-CoA mutase
MSESKELFKDFSTLSDEAWKEKVIADIKGKNFEETLLWEDENGITHKPYYRESDLESSDLLEAIQSAQKDQQSWQTLQCFSAQDGELKQRIDNALRFGVDQAVISDLASVDHLPEILGKKYDGKPQVKAYLNDLPTEHLLRYFYVDPIGERLKSGFKLDEVDERLSKLFQERLNQLEPDRFLLIDSSIYKMAGANIVQEMALSLHHAVEYFDRLTESGFKPEAVARAVEFKLTFGTSFFPEIAKGRAMRFLIKRLFQAYGVGDENSSLWGEGSLHYLAHKDPYTNLLRLTTMSMAAVLANCDKVSTPAFNQINVPSSLGIRMAKNTQLILKEEAYFAEVKDMASGSYYIESLSVQLAEAAWKKFLEYEKAGGLIKMFDEGKLKAELDHSLQKRKEAYRKKGKAMVGVNKYINLEADQLKVTEERVAEKGLNQYILATEIEESI